MCYPPLGCIGNSPGLIARDRSQAWYWDDTEAAPRKIARGTARSLGWPVWLTAARCRAAHVAISAAKAELDRARAALAGGTGPTVYGPGHTYRAPSLLETHEYWERLERGVTDAEAALAAAERKHRSAA